MFELRILSGLHRGATLPLDQRPHSIGVSEDADVVLVDADIEVKHASLCLTEDGWMLNSVEGSIRSADSNREESEMVLAPGDFARVGDVWITVVDRDAGWQHPPATPIEDLFDATAHDEEPLDGGHEEEAAPAPGRKAAIVARLRALLKNRKRTSIVALCTLVIVCGAVAFFKVAFNPPKMVRPLQPPPPVAVKPGKPAEPTVANAFDSTFAETDGKRKLTAAELRTAFRQRLTESDLIKRFDLQLQDKQWFMQASLDDEEAARFERILVGFLQKYDIRFPVHAAIGNGESMLPFKIRQVITGKNASVITQEGNQIYVGDEYRGVKLVSIKKNQITFAGRRKIEVVW